MAVSHPLTQPRTVALVILTAAVATFAAFKEPAQPAVAAQAAMPEAPPEPSDRTPPSWAFAAPGDIAGDSLSAEEAAGVTLTGKVLEQLDVAKYSYLRLGTPSGPEVWTAVPVTAACVGQLVVVSNAEQMTDFKSASLKRTFDVIYFGVLGQPPELAGAAPGFAAAGLAPNGDPHSAQSAPHPGAGPDADAVPVTKSVRAPGSLGRTVAELNALQQDAAGTKARVRGTIVKVTSGVMGRTFLHLRDATGVAPLANDLTATTSEELTLGSEVLLEGTVEIDRDFGAGYRYRVLLADARRVEP